jgi:hypothetical protein
MTQPTDLIVSKRTFQVQSASDSCPIPRSWTIQFDQLIFRNGHFSPTKIIIGPDGILLNKVSGGKYLSGTLNLSGHNYRINLTPLQHEEGGRFSSVLGGIVPLVGNDEVLAFGRKFTFQAVDGLVDSTFRVKIANISCAVQRGWYIVLAGLNDNRTHAFGGYLRQTNMDKPAFFKNFQNLGDKPESSHFVADVYIYDTTSHDAKNANEPNHSLTMTLLPNNTGTYFLSGQVTTLPKVGEEEDDMFGAEEGDGT